MYKFFSASNPMADNIYRDMLVFTLEMNEFQRSLQTITVAVELKGPEWIKSRLFPVNRDQSSVNEVTHDVFNTNISLFFIIDA